MWLAYARRNKPAAGGGHRSCYLVNVCGGRVAGAAVVQRALEAVQDAGGLLGKRGDARGVGRRVEGRRRLRAPAADEALALEVGEDGALDVVHEPGQRAAVVDEPLLVGREVRGGGVEEPHPARPGRRRRQRDPRARYDPELPQPSQHGVEEVSVLVLGARDHVTCSRDDVELEDVGYLRAVSERLPADAGVGERAADGEVEVVRPGPRREAVRQRGVQHVHPQLLAAGVDVAPVHRHGEPVVAPCCDGERRHVDDDAAGGRGLAPGGVAAAPGGDRERRGAGAGRPQQRGDVGRARRVEHGRRAPRCVHGHVGAEVGGRARRGLGVRADARCGGINVGEDSDDVVDDDGRRRRGRRRRRWGGERGRVRVDGEGREDVAEEEAERDHGGRGSSRRHDDRSIHLMMEL